jgi:RNA polymerase sigma factor (sigma-70 family)
MGSQRVTAPEGGSDADLIARVRDGDHDAYSMLYRRHVDAARRLARACCRSVQDADDVTADVFVSVLAAILHGKGPTDSFRPYLLRSIRNASANLGRAGRGAAAVQLDLHVGDAAVEESAGGRAAELRVALSTEDHDLETADERRLVAIAMRSLPEHYRSLLWQTEVENRSHEQIGRARGMSQASVATTALRARRAFCRAFLEAHLGDATEPSDRPSEPARACSGIRHLLAAFVRDECSPRRTRAVTEHLAMCATCRSSYRELCDVNAMLRHTPLGIVLAGPVVRRWFGAGRDAATVRTGEVVDVTSFGEVPATAASVGSTGTVTAKMLAAIGAVGARAAAVLVLTTAAGGASVVVLTETGDGEERIETAADPVPTADSDIDGVAATPAAPPTADEPTVATVDEAATTATGLPAGLAGAGEDAGSPAAGESGPAGGEGSVPAPTSTGGGEPPAATVPPADVGSGVSVTVPGIGVEVGGDTTATVSVDLDGLGVGQVVDDVAAAVGVLPIVGVIVEDVVSSIDTTIEVTVPTITVPAITTPTITTPPLSTPVLSVPSVTVSTISLPPVTLAPLDPIVDGLLDPGS